MRPTDITATHVISRYVAPARSRGETTVRVRAGNVLKELGWTNRTPSICSTLSSDEFQKSAGVKLIEKSGGPPSGGPSTTVQFVYRVLPGNATSPVKSAGSAVQSDRSGNLGLLAMYGIAAGLYREVGGGEAFLRAQRENFGSIVPDDWESSVEGKK